ncbi:hypothetical protein, partial [Streptomyces fructofermentans]|uniref:hypothetical protein n=1 Tax=Streptomyces fructofermentans TaxID=152141 RepID=UPI001E626808
LVSLFRTTLLGACPETSWPLRIVYGFLGLILNGTALLGIHLWAGPGLEEVIRGMGAGAVLGAAGWLLLTRTFVPKAVAAYSSWWMPKVERTAHRQDILYALTRASWGIRSRHAWELLKSSPRAGLRARRHHARLRAAVAR